MEKWTVARRAFAIKAYYKNGISFVKAQHLFRHFEIHCNDLQCTTPAKYPGG
jgi:hypothetical protein